MATNNNSNKLQEAAKAKSIKIQALKNLVEKYSGKKVHLVEDHTKLINHFAKVLKESKIKNINKIFEAVKSKLNQNEDEDNDHSKLEKKKSIPKKSEPKKSTEKTKTK